MPADPPKFGPSDKVDVRRLVPGAVVRRWTEPIHARDEQDWTKPSHVHVPAPCCGRLFRRVATEDAYELFALCCPCQRLYRLTVIDTNDGGFDAVLTVEPDIEPLIVASHRKPRAA